MGEDMVAGDVLDATAADMVWGVLVVGGRESESEERKR
jgi:formylmethanofuran dehydrogenase subunit C